MMRVLAILAAVLACLFGAASAREGVRPADLMKPDTVYVHVDLVDVEVGEVWRDMAVYVAGERIDLITPTAVAARLPAAGLRIVDMRGHYLLPGLIDSHVHLTVRPDRAFAEANLRRDLYAGITAERDMAGDARLLGPLAAATKSGKLPGPDIRYAAFMAGRSFFEADGDRPDQMSRGVPTGTAPWNLAIDEATDLRAAVTKARETGAAGIKLYANLAPAQVAALSAEARRQGMQVWAHAMIFGTTPAELLAARPDAVSHTCYLAYQAMDPRPALYHDRDRFPVDPAPFMDGVHPALAELFATMKRDGVVLDATNTVYALVERLRASAPEGRGPPIYCSSALSARLTAQAYKAGVMISAGTDVASEPGDAWPSLHGELEILVRQVGMTPLDALRAATLNGARALGQEEEMGDIAYGKLANMVFVKANPLDDIAALRTVVLTVKRGREYWRRDYRQPKPEDLDRNR